MAKRSRQAATNNGDGTVTIDCGCVYFANNGRGPLRPCESHRYMMCASCGKQGQVTPFGFMCPTCSFAEKKVPA